MVRVCVVQAAQGWGSHHKTCKAEGKDPAKAVISLGLDCVPLEHLVL